MKSHTTNKKIELIRKAIESSEIMNKEFIKTIEVVEDKFADEQYIVKVRFHHDMLSEWGRDETLDDIWNTVYNYTNIPVGLVNLNKLDNKTIKESEDKTVKLLSKFLEEYEVQGICGFWVDEEPDDHDKYWVYIILDLDTLEDHPTKPGFVADRYRRGLQSEIKKFLGIDVMVGSISRRCSELN
jgi:RNAse (barnase) inhibitor barstar